MTIVLPVHLKDKGNDRVEAELNIKIIRRDGEFIYQYVDNEQD